MSGAAWFFSCMKDPEKWEPVGRSFWCPRMVQPLVFWILRKLGAK